MACASELKKRDVCQKQNTRLRADWVVFIDELCILTTISTI